MGLELSILIGFLLHFVGDYLLQNDWMAQNKTKEAFPCFVHCVIYTLPFGLILWQSPFIWVIFITHYLIDRYRLAEYWIRLVNNNWSGDNFGYSANKPKYLSVWLLIIIDNTFHVIINTLSIFLSKI